MSIVGGGGAAADADAGGRTMRKAEVYAGHPDHAFPYYLGADCSDAIRRVIAALEPDRLLVVTDESVWRRHGTSLDGLRSAVETIVLEVPRGEGAKRPTVLTDVLARAVEEGATRQSVVVTFGGGATGNLGGLVAALLFRGVRLVHLPTTTIGAFDSVLSMKQAVNSDSGKNQIGTYLRPVAVMVDTRWFETLPPEVARGGWCEAAKNALAIHPATIDVLGRSVAETDSHRRWAALFDLSLTAKMMVMADDPYERREGLALEYGHTIGHAIEYAAAESARAIPHGDAISLGMIAAARVSRHQGYLDEDAVRVHEDLAARVGAPTRLPRDLDLGRVLALVRRDNKRGLVPCRDQEIAMVLLAELGRPMTARGEALPLTRVPIALVESVLADLVERPGEAPPGRSSEHLTMIPAGESR